MTASLALRHVKKNISKALPPYAVNSISLNLASRDKKYQIHPYHPYRLFSEPPMPKKKRKQPSAQQPKKSTQERREARQKRVQKVLKYLQILGLPTSCGGIAGTLVLFKAGQYRLAALTAFVSVAALFLAVGGKFVKELVEQVLDNIEERLDKVVEPLAD